MNKASNINCTIPSGLFCIFKISKGAYEGQKKGLNTTYAVYVSNKA